MNNGKERNTTMICHHKKVKHRHNQNSCVNNGHSTEDSSDMMELGYQHNKVLSNRQSASLFNAISTQTVPVPNFIRKTNAELMQVALIGRK